MDHDLEVRSILSHALLGVDNISKETFELCVSETVRYIEKELAESHIGNVNSQFEILNKKIAGEMITIEKEIKCKVRRKVPLICAICKKEMRYDVYECEGKTYCSKCINIAAFQDCIEPEPIKEKNSDKIF